MAHTFTNHMKETKPLKITEENWLTLTIAYLTDLSNSFKVLSEHEEARKIEKLIRYLNKTN